MKHIDPLKFDVHLFPSIPFRSIHPDIQNSKIHLLISQSHPSPGYAVNLEFPYPFIKRLSTVFGRGLIKRLLIKWGVNEVQRKALIKTIQNVRPDVIHTMETQQAGYLYDSVAINSQRPLPWIHSTWGIDLHFYKNIPRHQEKLRKLLSKISLLIVEGERDKLLAQKLGYDGTSKIIPSVGGGFDFEQMDKLYHFLPPSKRKKILVKGYEDRERLASAALLALRKLALILAGYEVIVYSCSNKLLPLIDEIQHKKEFQIIHFPDTAHADLLNWANDARMSITNNLSDGVPNTMLEAMALGAFPIQSNTAITEGWIEDGKNGLLTNPNDVNQIAEAVSKALTDDKLVDDAAVFNRKRVMERLNLHTIKSQIEDLYTTAVVRPATKAL
jgi:glycosyltransferase involved in cell wall biosynthesis